MRGTGRAAALLLAALLPLTGCAAVGAAPADAPSPEPSRAPLAASVDELSVTADLYRTRSDPGRGGIQLSLANGAASPLAVRSARLESPALAAPMLRRDEATVPAGQRRDLPLRLPAPVCGDPAPAPPEAVLEIELDDGSIVELRVATADRIGQWARWHEEACFASAVAGLAALRLEAVPPAEEGEIGVRLVAAPGAVGDGAPGGLRLIEVSGSVLLSALDAEGRPVTSIPVPVGRAGAPTELDLRYSPARCDAHAIADDKQGTHLRVRVAIKSPAGERQGEVVVVPDAVTRDALLSAVLTACASPARDDRG
ncbi:hypothetical protein OVN18_10100 [Microcella daejeonensis]|uniref:Uncharacterized protein n=1 Tax=Microcella daejeonensis TaxID=2994971 RepID=A0A9E8MJX3_9MICO|nr:hypothetical protein [Microcella daejeonensis]WAB80909.1 hypothetical protein OVN18_10100 [Microcella daejeonensis]